MMTSDKNDQVTTPQPAISFYGKMLTFSRLQLHTDDPAAIEAHLASLVSNKNSNIPVVIDSSVEQNLSALVDLLWSWGLQPIGVVTGVLDEQARMQRLAIFPSDGKRIERILPTKKPKTEISQTIEPNTVTEVPPTDNEAEVGHTHDHQTHIDATVDTPSETLISADHITSMIYDQMLRSGQSINHVGGDLILTNSINSGAEAITDNSLHVYGRAQGRLVAGATGDKDARIFCQVFNPSLVSVAGTYCLRDNLPAETIDKPVQVRYIEGEGLVFTVMDNL